MSKKPKPAKRGDLIEGLERIRAAGGHAWDGVKDPVRVIREMRGGSMAKRKPKPATAGEKIVLRRVRETLGPKTMTLEEFRTRAVLEHCQREAKDHDAALRRERMKERRRCSRIVVAGIGGEIDDATMLAKVRNGEAT